MMRIIKSTQVHQTGLSWPLILSHWELIELDFQQHYGLDLAAGLMGTRTGRWVRRRILGLLSVDGSRLRHVLIPPPKQQDQEGR